MKVVEEKIENLHLQPGWDRHIVLPDPTKEKVGSLFLPDQAKNIPTIGTILSSGEPSNNKKLFGQARDRIIYGKYAGINYNAGDDSEYKIILDAEILCKIKVD